MPQRALALAVLALLGAACAANPKTVNPSTDVKDGAAAEAKPDATAAAAPAPAPRACTGDAQCGDDEHCGPAGTCEAGAPAPRCDLVKVRFAFDSAQLDESARGSLRSDADCIGKRRASALLIEGHCDERGTAQYNIALGARRADAVRRYLADLGVKTKLETVSFGKELPVASGSDEGAWSQNRRAEFRLPGEKRSDGQLVAGN